MDLSPSEDELLANMRKSTRYSVRKAAREGVEVVEPEDFEEAWKTFYGWMEDTAERKSGFTIRRPQGVPARHDADDARRGAGAPVPGRARGHTPRRRLRFTFGQKYWFMHGASSTEKRTYNPNHLLQWEVMRWARERGIDYYDMVGIPKPENRNEDDPYYGVYRFKIGFGGNVTDFVGCLDLPTQKRPRQSLVRARAGLLPPLLQAPRITCSISVVSTSASFSMSASRTG